MRVRIVTLIMAGLAIAGGTYSLGQTPSTSDLARLFLGRAADKPPQACVDKIAAAMHEPDDAARKLAFSYILNPNTSPLCGAYLILSSSQFAKASTASRGELLKAAEEQFGAKALGELKAVAQQEGTATGTGGSTSLTAKGLSSKLLSVATEYGALTESTSKATTTIQGTLAGVPVVIMQKGILAECSVKVFALAPCLHQGALEWLSRISYAISYDTSAGSGMVVGTPTSNPGTGTAQQVNVTNNANSVSTVSGKAVLIPGKLSASSYSDADKKIAGSESIPAVLAAQQAFASMERLDTPTDSPYLTYVEQEVAHLSGFSTGHNQNETVKEWRAAADDFTESLGAPKSMDATKAAESQVIQQASILALKYLQYLGDEEAAGFAAIIAAPPVLTVEYDWNRPSSAPSNSVLRAIFERSYKPITITFNGAISIYDEPQPGVPGAVRLRDSQFAAEISHPVAVTLPGSNAAANFTLSGAFYDQYQSSPAILNVTPGAPANGVTFVNLPSTATQVFGTKGNIAIGQLKLTSGGGSAVTVPISVTYSNRTELITKPTWKAQIGVSYDFDSLFRGK